MIILKLVFRNIFLYTSRNILVFLIIGVVSLVLFLFISFTDGQIENFKESWNAIMSPLSQIRVYSKAYQEAESQREPWAVLVGKTITGYHELEKAIAKFDFVKSVFNPTSTMYVTLLYKDESYSGINLRGIAHENNAYILDKLKITEGFGLSEEQTNVILLNASMKDTLGAKVGDKITLLGTDSFNQAVIEDFTVSGYYKPKIDNPNLSFYVYADMTGFNMISGYYPDETLRLFITLNKGKKVQEILPVLRNWAKENGHDIIFVNSTNFSSGNNSIYSTVRLIIILFSFIIIFITCYGVMNTISINLCDRKKEIATYYCLGAEKWFLKIFYILEILLINTAASFSGIGLALIIRFIINKMQITTTDPGLQLFFAGDRFYLGFNVTSILWIISGILILTLLTSTFTLNATLKVQPVIALKELE